MCECYTCTSSFAPPEMVRMTVKEACDKGLIQKGTRFKSNADDNYTQPTSYEATVTDYKEGESSFICDYHSCWYIRKINTSAWIEIISQPAMGIIKQTMCDIVKCVKGLGLSKDEKLMRKHGLKDEYGNYTQAYKDIVLAKQLKDAEPGVIADVRTCEAEAKEESKKA